MDGDVFILRPTGFGDLDMGFAAIVGGRQQPHAGLPASAQRGRDVREPIAGVEHLGADQVCRQVSITESEPVGIGSVGSQFLLGVPGFVRRPQPRPESMPPPRVYMQVSRSGQIRMPCIRTSSPTLTMAVMSWLPGASTGSPDSLSGGEERCGAQKRTHSEQESGAADTAGEHGHFHRNEYRGAVGKGRIDMDGSSVLT